MRTGLYFRNFLGLGPNIPMFVRPQIIVREKPVRESDVLLEKCL